MKRRVAITGLGLVTPCGIGWEAYWKAVLDARSHIRRLSSMSLNGFPFKLGGEIPDFRPGDFVSKRKFLKVMSREIQLAVAASRLALQDSGLNEMSELDRDRFGISLGTGIINNDLDEVGIGIRSSLDETGKFRMDKFGSEGIRALFPLWFLKYLPNMPACHISIHHGLRGPSNTVTTSSAAGAQAIGEAFRVIERGDADLMIAGSTDSKINAMGISRFSLLGLLSARNHIPEEAYCPFDKNHDGIILGEGAGLLVLEAMDHAKARGARIYGELIGYGCASDYNYDPRSTQDFTGKKVAISRALNDASVEPKEVDFIVANGSGIPSEDIQESHAIQGIFERSMGKVKVTAVKPVTGHLIYGSGGVEFGSAVLGLHEGVIPPLANLSEAAPDCQLPFVYQRAQAAASKISLFNSFGFGGQNAALVIRKAE